MRMRVITVVAAIVGLAAGMAVPAHAVTKPKPKPKPIVYAPSSALALSEVSCHDDWVELVNTDRAHPVKLGGVQIADHYPIDATDVRFRFAAGKELKAGAFTTVASSALGFRIGCGSDHVYLLDARARRLDEVTSPNLAEPFTWSRIDGSWSASVSTPRSANASVPADVETDRAAWLFHALRELQVRLEIEPQDLQRLATQPKTYGLVKPQAYVPARFSVIDQAGQVYPPTGPIAVGVRVYGGVGSRTSSIYGPDGLTILNGKVNLRVKFNWSVKGQTFYGLKKLALASMTQDATMTHEAATYALFRAMDVWAPRTGYANLTINGEQRGLFLTLESADDIAMSWRMPDMRHVYQPNRVLIDGNWIFPEIRADAIGTAIQAEEGDAADMRDLQALTAAVESSTTITPAIARQLDVAEMARFFAVEKFVSHWDGYSGSVYNVPNNFLMAADAAGRFTFLPWGADTTWRALAEPELDARGREPFGSARGVMFTLCMNDDYCRSAYAVALSRISRLMPEFATFTQTLASFHYASLASDSHRFFDAWATDYSRQQMDDFLATRPDDVRQFLAQTVTGAVRWNPASLTLAKGSPLTALHLDAYSDVPGTFLYSVALGTTLPTGHTTVSLTFTPADAAYQPQTVTREFTVG